MICKTNNNWNSASLWLLSLSTQKQYLCFGIYSLLSCTHILNTPFPFAEAWRTHSYQDKSCRALSRPLLLRSWWFHERNSYLTLHSWFNLQECTVQCIINVQCVIIDWKYPASIAYYFLLYWNLYYVKWLLPPQPVRLWLCCCLCFTVKYFATQIKFIFFLHIHVSWFLTNFSQMYQC